MSVKGVASRGVTRSKSTTPPAGPSAVAGAELSVGDRVNLTATPELEGIVRFVGSTNFAQGEWVGVELDTPNGKNDGSVKGARYFECEPMYGVFTRITGVEKASEALVSRSRSNAEEQAFRKTIGAQSVLDRSLKSPSRSSTNHVFGTSVCIDSVGKPHARKESHTSSQTTSTTSRRISAPISENEEKRGGGLDPRALRSALAEAMEERDLEEVSRFALAGDVESFRVSMTAAVDDFQKRVTNVTDQLLEAAGAFRQAAKAFKQQARSIEVVDSSQSGTSMQQVADFASVSVKIESMESKMDSFAHLASKFSTPSGSPQLTGFESDNKLQSQLAWIESKLDTIGIKLDGMAANPESSTCSPQAAWMQDRSLQSTDVHGLRDNTELLQDCVDSRAMDKLDELLTKSHPDARPSLKKNTSNSFVIKAGKISLSPEGSGSSAKRGSVVSIRDPPLDRNV